MIESNRVPFDMPEADSEIVAGYHTEYSSMKFAMYFMGEYAAMVVLSALIVTLFLGGWQLPFIDIKELIANQYICAAIGFSVFFGKVFFFLWFFVWVRWTFPRFRFDQIMRLGWKILFPLGLANLLITALFVLLFWDKVESFFNSISIFAG
jgi:NADH-quinone oxidoreductase subunit H